MAAYNGLRGARAILATFATIYVQDVVMVTALGLDKPWKWSRQDTVVDVVDKFVNVVGTGLVFDNLLGASAGLSPDLGAHAGAAPAPAAAPVPALEHETSTRRVGGSDLLEAVTWPDGYRPHCPACAEPTTGLQEKLGRIRGVREPVVIATALPCGCHVDDHAAALQTGAAAAPRPAPRSETPA